MSDPRTQDLLARFATGDREAYAVLVARYAEPLERFVRGHLSARLRARLAPDDVLQEVHAEALVALDQGRFVYRRELSFFFWLCGIARRRIYGHARRLRFEAPMPRFRVSSGASSRDLIGALRDDTRDAVERVSLREHLELLACALERLPARRREAIILRYLEGHNTAEAAARIGTTAPTFRVLLSRALVQLRDHLADLLGEAD